MPYVPRNTKSEKKGSSRLWGDSLPKPADIVAGGGANYGYQKGKGPDKKSLPELKHSEMFSGPKPIRGAGLGSGAAAAGAAGKAAGKGGRGGAVGAGQFSKPKAAAKPAAKAKSYSSGSISKPDKSYKQNRDELGAFYLQATKDMGIHSRKKK
jgi:hypothetical protein